MSTPNPTSASIKLAQTISITGTLYLLGSSSSLSWSAVPAIMQAPAPLAVKQWYTVFTRGGSLARPLCVISGLATAFVAWHQDPKSIRFKLNVAAALLVPGIIPFTLAFILPINTKLIAKKDQLAKASLEDNAVEAGVKRGETVHELLDKWALANVGRGVLLSAGGLCAVLSAIWS